MDKNDPPIFAVSYARADAEFPRFREELQKLISDLKASVAVKVPAPLESVCFQDVSSIRTGDDWSSALADGFMRCRVGVALYTPNYFTHEWCGREFQVLLDRRPDGLGMSGIVPVLWNPCRNLPDCVQPIQYADSAFPAEYLEVGLQQLLRLKTVYPDRYDLAVEALAKRIVEAAAVNCLKPLAGLDFTSIRSAWETSLANNPQSHTEGGISKTCFVYVSRQGWNWEPYSGTPPRIGALAQKISGELGLRYEEIPCDGDLPQKLMEANSSNVPTVLFGDPGSLYEPAYSLPMRQYDSQYLLNCAALVPWEPELKDRVDSDSRWTYLKTRVCKQKVRDPPPHHEWRSIFSYAELDSKTRTTIEQIRSRLMKQLMSDSIDGGAAPRKAEDSEISENAAALGIQTGSLSQLEAPSR